MDRPYFVGPVLDLVCVFCETYDIICYPVNADMYHCVCKVCDQEWVE